tara:strand:- start:1207 stop:1602 length:396 start_codon:yes stop_codon:yes gene_type:complete
MRAPDSVLEKWTEYYDAGAMPHEVYRRWNYILAAEGYGDPAQVQSRLNLLDSVDAHLIESGALSYLKTVITNAPSTEGDIYGFTTPTNPAVIAKTTTPPPGAGRFDLGNIQTLGALAVVAFIAWKLLKGRK